jgi:hypothetical protein
MVDRVVFVARSTPLRRMAKYFAASGVPLHNVSSTWLDSEMTWRKLFSSFAVDLIHWVLSDSGMGLGRSVHAPSGRFLHFAAAKLVATSENIHGIGMRVADVEHVHFCVNMIRAGCQIFTAKKSASTAR